MLAKVWKLFKRVAFVLTIALIMFGTLIAVLAVRTQQPRASNTWARLPDLPNPRGEATAAVGVRLADTPPGTTPDSISPQVLVIGGLAGLGRTVDTVDVFNPDTGEWLPGPPLPEPRHHMAAAGIEGTVYVSGGSKRATDWTPESNMWRLRPRSDDWEELPALPDARMGHQMVAVQDRLFIVGGRGASAEVLVFNTTTNEWEIGAAIPEPRDHLGVAVVGLQLFAIGGRDGALTTRVDRYDILSDTWTEGPPLPEPMSAMAVARLTDGIHVVGGEDPGTLRGSVIDKHYVLAAGGTEWRDAPLPILATHGSAAVELHGSLFVTGGARRQGALSPIGWTGLTQLYTPGRFVDPTPSPTNG